MATAAGMEPVTIQPVEADARGSVPFVVRTRAGERWFVKAVGREQRDADLLYKLWHWAAFREVEDPTPFATPSRRWSTRPISSCWPPGPR